MSKFENGYEWKGESTKRKESRKKKKKVNTFNIVLYCISAILILTGLIMLFNEFVLITKNETEGLAGASDMEYDIYAESTPYQPLATPIDDYDMIPVKFHFIDREVSCDIIPTGIGADGTMGTVDKAEDATWLSVHPYVIPGDTGNAVIAGHNRWHGKAGTFSLLKKMNKGEVVAVEFNVKSADGKKRLARYFEVVDKYECKYNDTRPMKTKDVDEPILTLITCMGDWSNTLQQSKTRVIVICKPLSSN